jgi:hypothetical protein
MDVAVTCIPRFIDLVLYSDTAVLCRYCFFSHIPIVGYHMSILVGELVIKQKTNKLRGT